MGVLVCSVQGRVRPNFAGRFGDGGTLRLTLPLRSFFRASSLPCRSAFVLSVISSRGAPFFLEVASVDWPGATIGIYAVFVILSVSLAGRKALGKHSYFDSYLNYTWIYFLSFAVCERISFTAGIWILALVSFWALREYFSLIHIRLQDRLGVLVAYLSIPFMFYFIQIDWYGMFIVSIPVYAYLAIPLFVALGEYVP